VRRTGLMFVIIVLVLVVGSRASLAATIRCDGGLCEGTGGSDTLRGSAIRDLMRGLGGDDKLYGNRGADEMYGNNGKDRVRGGYGADEMYGNRGRDLLRGARGNDQMSGGPDNDDFYADAGADYGGSGRDRMAGGPGRDHLYGGLYNDTIASQDGVFDVVNCGPGGYDAAVIDRGLDRVTNCENVYSQ
jgi:Ca2+-binding RTX toxin-like protein